MAKKTALICLMKEFAIIFIGGGIGSCLRYAISAWLNPISTLFAWGTLASNVFACLILGFLASLFESKFIESEQIKFFVMVGICGGFSTFSTFSHELFTYFQNGRYASFVLYALSSLILCYLGIFLGFALGKVIM